MRDTFTVTVPAKPRGLAKYIVRYGRCWHGRGGRTFRRAVKDRSRQQSNVMLRLILMASIKPVDAVISVLFAMDEYLPVAQHYRQCGDPFSAP